MSKLGDRTYHMIVVSQRKALTFRKVYYLSDMKTTKEKIAQDPVECAQSLRNVIDAMFVLNGKWKMALILCISQSSKRFSEIQSEVPISPKVLANELKHLELNNFIKRNVFPTTPVTIIYEATEYCQTLKNVICELDQWGEKHRKVLTGK